MQLSARDGRGGRSEQSFNLEVQADASNDRPQITSSPPPGPVAVDYAYEYQVTAVDPNGDQVTFLLELGPDGMSIDQQSGLLSWTPSDAWSVGDTVPVRILASDPRGGSVRQWFVLEVDDLNYAPRVISDPPGPATVDLPYEYLVVAEDLNGDPLSFSFTDSPSGMQIDATTGLITWTPSAAGNYDVKIAVTDARGEVGGQSFELEVVATGSNQDPEFTSEPPAGPAATGLEFRYQATASDLDGDPLTFGLSSPPG